MQIAELRIHPIAIADPPLRSSYGLHAPYALRAIVELESDDGVIGISETYGGDAQVRQLEALRPQLVGANPYRLTGALWPMVEDRAGGEARSQTWLVPGENALDALTRAYAAIEVACLDLIGKTVGEPVCDLIGGRVRDEVPFSAYPFYKHAGGGGEGIDAREDEYGEALSPEAIVGQVQKMIAQYGFGSIKFKGGVLDPAVEIETIKQLYRTFGPKVPLRIDPNCAWTVETSVRVGRALAEELGRGGYLEDATGQQCRRDQLRRHPALAATGGSADHSVRPSLLGRHEAGATSGPAGPHYGPWPIHAFQHAPGHFAYGNGSCGCGHAASDLRLRHPLPLPLGRG